MRTPRTLAGVMGLATGRPRLVVALLVLLAVVGGGLALRLTPQTSTDTFVGRGTDEYQASQRYHQKFGDDAIYVLIEEDVSKLVLTSDIERPLGLEGCLSGALPKGSTPTGGAGGPCGQLARKHPAQVVFGPGTFLNTSIGQIDDQVSSAITQLRDQTASAGAAAQRLAQARHFSPARSKAAVAQAQQLVQNQFVAQFAPLALKYGIGLNGQLPQLNDPSIVSQLVFDGSRSAGTPKAKFAYIFPRRNAALIQVRLRPDLTTQEREDAIGLIRRAVAMPQWRLPNGHGTYLVTGAPVVVSDLTRSISHSILLLILGALVAMALTLTLVFRTRLRLLPLVVALASTGITFGLLSALGASLTMASIGVLPVLIGLGVDYAIQLQARLQEEDDAERAGARPGARPGIAGAAQRVARAGAPTVLTAATATAAGFLVLELSPVPMVRGFGVLLVGGIAISLLVALTLGTAVLTLAERPARARRRRLPGAALGAGVRRAVTPALRGAGELVFDAAPARAVAGAGRRLGRGALGLATTRPERVLAVGAALAVVGWGVGTQAHVESDVTKLVPPHLPALANLTKLQDRTGVGGEVDTVVSSDHLTDPAVFRWMASYQQQVLKGVGYSSRRGCGQADLCPALSLPDLFQGGAAKTTKAINQLLDVIPPYLSQGVITNDRHTATLAFGIRLMSLERQKRVIDRMQVALRTAPKGVTAELAGLPVLTAEANARIASPWRRALQLLAGLAVVGLVLRLALGAWRRALVPLIPIALASGWSGVVLWVSGIELNPMSVTLGALVIAISTEFSVLLAERHRRERLAGHPAAEALRRTYASTGAAVLASGVTALVGFAVLTLSDIRMLRDFGAVTVIDLSVSLLGVLVVLPAVLVLDGREDGLRAWRGRRLRLPRRPAPGRRRRRRGAPGPAAPLPPPPERARIPA